MPRELRIPKKLLFTAPSKIKLWSTKEEATLFQRDQYSREARIYLHTTKTRKGRYHSLHLVPHIPEKQNISSEGAVTERPSETPLPIIMNANILEILKWNVRGTRHPLFIDHMMEMIRAHNRGILILFKTRVVAARAETISKKLPYSTFESVDPERYKVACGFYGMQWE